jgi:hypothetical protein
MGNFMEGKVTQTFISYASEDAIFADLVKMKLKDAGITVWLDHGKLRVGDEWRKVIDEGISSSNSIIVIITPKSCQSSYVTYEWAYALGKGLKIIPLLLKDAEIHPRLDVLQYLDFRNQREGPWEVLFREIDTKEDGPKKELGYGTDSIAIERISDYFKRTGYKMISFEGVRKYIDPIYEDEFLQDLIRRNYKQLRIATLKGGKKGVAFI